MAENLAFSLYGKMSNDWVKVRNKEGMRRWQKGIICS
jgi:hypothetical protein